MAQLDPFARQIVEMVRNMPDEALLELVKTQLQLDGGELAAPSATTTSTTTTRKKRTSKKRAAKATAKKASRKKSTRKKATRKRDSRGDREALLGAVEKAVKSGNGMSASEIANKTKIPQNRVASALRELKGAKRIFQGGDRRFARYAGDARSAEKASLRARKNASGPKKR